MEEGSFQDQEDVNLFVNNGDVVTEVIMEQESIEEEDNFVAGKRTRPLGEGEDWILVGRDGKRYRLKGNISPEITPEAKFQISISSTVELPKQFAFARLMRDCNISNILKIRYINPFKISLLFENEESLQTLLNCQEIKDKGWRIYKTIDVDTSYGVIRNVEQEMKEDEIRESISCDIEILNVKRLTRRSDNGEGWTDSESIRIYFKGPYLPPYVNIHGLRVKVTPYTFPVTQCSNCWRFGHTRKMCTKKRVCPKCSRNHENCELTSFTCVNCSGRHLALSKICPAYLKEKKIRSIMAEYNCTYRKAFSIYDNEITAMNNIEMETNTRVAHSADDQEFVMESSPLTTTYASAVKSRPVEKETQLQGDTATHSRKKKKISKEREPIRGNNNKHNNDEFNFNWDSLSATSDREENCEPTNERNNYNSHKKMRWEKEDISGMTFENLVETMKNIFFRNNEPFINKLTAAGRLGYKWLVSFLAGYIYDLPFIKPFMAFNG